MKVSDILHESMNNVDLNSAYELFTQSYNKHTGNTWSKEKFMSRARNWKFYGDTHGFIAVRPQHSGMIKLVGTAGHPRSVMKGMRELMNEHTPVWGMMSGELIPLAKKFGMIQPPAIVIKMLMKVIPSSVWGDVPISVNKDGSITFQYSDVGDATKFFIATPEYFKHLLTSLSHNSKAQQLPKYALTKITNIIQGLIS